LRKHPNIIWIYCDELRTDALGCYGNPLFRLSTPNIDRLADQGLCYTNSFCNSPICVSSRICTLTALYCEQTGCYSNEGAWKNFRLPQTLETFPQVFLHHGYATANFGKVHVAPEMLPDPTNPGKGIFAHHNPDGSSMQFWRTLGEEAVQMIRSPNGGMQGGVWPEGTPYPPDAVVTNALKWIEEARVPNFVRISLLQPHTPVLPLARHVPFFLDQVPPTLAPRVAEGLARYEKRIAETHGLARMDPEAFRKTVAHYYAQVTWIDEQVGRVLDFLDAQGLREQTILAFGADHGKALGDTGGYEKHGFMPAVHRVPFLLAWPGTLPAGERRDEINESLDLARTLLELAGLPAPDSFRGRSLVSAPPPQAVFATHSHGRPFSRMGPNGGRGEWYGGRGWPRRSCVRTAQWRFEKNMLLDSQVPTDPADVDAFLCDWRADPREETNRAHDPRCQAIAAELSALLDRHANAAVDVPDACLQR